MAITSAEIPQNPGPVDDFTEKHGLMRKNPETLQLYSGELAIYREYLLEQRVDEPRPDTLLVD